MAIKPINHYSLTTNPSVYDEEAMTALELASRTAGKMNETVRAFNELEESTGERLDAQDQRIPVEIAAKVDEHIEGGQFDAQIAEYAGNVNARLDNLIAQTPNAPTTMDAEIIDVRVAPTNDTYANAGEAVRESLKTALNAHQGVVKFSQATINTPDASVIPCSTRVVSSLLAADNVIMIAPSDGYKIKVFWYDEKLEMVANEGFATAPVYGSDHAFPYLRFIVAKEDDSEITVGGLTGEEYRLITEKELLKNGYVKISNLPAGQGTVNSNGVVEHRTNRVYSPMMKADFAVILPEKNHLIMSFYYDAEFKLISKMDDFSHNPVFADQIPESAVYVRIATRTIGSGDLSHADGCHFTIYTKDADVLKRCEAQAPAFVHEMMNIAYSEIGMGKINTAPHFRAAAHLGFNALKGDVEITDDNGLIMCHDAGFTMKDGYITDYNPDDCILFKDTRFEDLLELQYEETIDGLNYYTFCTFEDYLRICVETGKIAYITLRQTKIPELVEGVFELLKKYNMTDRCIINSYTYETLQTVRAYSATVPVSQVLQYQSAITKNDVERVLALGNSIATLFYYPDATGYQAADVWEASADVIQYAHDRGLILHNAQVKTMDAYLTNVRNGIKGMHITKKLCPYQREKITLAFNVESGSVSCNDERFNVNTVVFSNRVGIGKIAFKGTTARYSDAFPPYYFENLPYELSVKCSANPDATIRYVSVNKRIEFTIGTTLTKIDGTYYVTIEV